MAYISSRFRRAYGAMQTYSKRLWVERWGAGDRIMDNADVAAILYEIADLLDLQGIAFKPIAYRKAASSIEQLEEPISKVVEEGRLKEVKGVGESIAKKVEEIVRTGKLAYLEKLRKEVPPELTELVKVPDVGPKTAMVLYKEFGIKNLEQLKKALTEHRLHGTKGFGEKTEERILQGIRTLEATGGRMLLGEAFPAAASVVDYLRSEGLDLVSIAGSLRRGKETIGDIDILVGSDRPDQAMKAFIADPEVEEVILKGPSKSSVRLKTGLQVDMRVVEVKSWGAALQYFTGSKEHNVALRSIGIKMGYKLNEYGVFDRKSGKMVAGATEEEVYKLFGMKLMPPEMRENTGELEAAKDGKLPELVELGDIKGDLHVHTNWSDGSSTLKEIIPAAMAKGYQYIGVSDHSQGLKIANGLSQDRMREQMELLRKTEKELGGKLRIFSGSEVDIKPDGSLDYPKSLLDEMDVVIASVHSRFRMSRSEMTERMVTAIDSGLVDIIGHPTGRVIGQREPYEVDLERVFEEAKKQGVLMEVNSFPERLDLRDAHCRLAKQAGVKIAIDTDSHHVSHLDNMRFGVITARRGWLERRDVLNTQSSKDVEGKLHGRR